MNMAHGRPLGAGAADGRMNWSVGRAPAHHRQLTGRIAQAYILLGNIVGDAKHLVTAKLGHRLMVGGRIIDMASAHRLFDAADAVQQTGCAGLRSEEHTSELQSLMRISYAVFCLKTKNNL